MDTSITISAVSVIIACCSFGVAYRAFLHSTESRKADKLLGLRIQVVELRSKFEELKHNSQSLSKKQPTIHDPFINEKLRQMIDYGEEIHNALCKDLSYVTEKDLDDMTISILNSKSDLELEAERIKKMSDT